MIARVSKASMYGVGTNLGTTTSAYAPVGRRPRRSARMARRLNEPTVFKDSFAPQKCGAEERDRIRPQTSQQCRYHMTPKSRKLDRRIANYYHDCRAKIVEEMAFGSIRREDLCARQGRLRRSDLHLSAESPYSAGIQVLSGLYSDMAAATFAVSGPRSF